MFLCVQTMWRSSSEIDYQSAIELQIYSRYSLKKVQAPSYSPYWLRTPERGRSWVWLRWQLYSYIVIVRPDSWEGRGLWSSRRSWVRWQAFKKQTFRGCNNLFCLHIIIKLLWVHYVAVFRWKFCRREWSWAIKIWDKFSELHGNKFSELHGNKGRQGAIENQWQGRRAGEFAFCFYSPLFLMLLSICFPFYISNLHLKN